MVTADGRGDKGGIEDGCNVLELTKVVVSLYTLILSSFFKLFAVVLFVQMGWLLLLLLLFVAGKSTLSSPEQVGRISHSNNQVREIQTVPFLIILS